MTQSIANRSIRCSLCAYVIGPGEIFWQLTNEPKGQSFAICPGHIPLNSTGVSNEASADTPGITYARPEALDVRKAIIPRLLGNWDEVYALTPDQFEELIFDRLIAMGLQPIRLGSSNQKDGGIDLIFWTPTLFPMLGAVQVKHHQTPKHKTGPAEVRELAGAMRGYHFNIGLVVTNTSFTDDANFESEKDASPPIQLRDGEALRKWIADDFDVEEINFVTRTIEICRGLGINIPKFL